MRFLIEAIAKAKIVFVVIKCKNISHFEVYIFN